jgi:4-amino-4-deoxy-L-arabinose transferase-like glycosyltransferase
VRRHLSSLLGSLLGRLARIPTAAWVCALLALANATCWSLITPPFLALDEPDHFSYVQVLAESGRLPSSPLSEYSPQERLALQDLHQPLVRFNPAGHTIFSSAAQRKLESDLEEGEASKVGPGGAGVAASEPPLYYALQTIPYRIASGGSILDQLQLMRLFSALLAGFTALFVFLFLREALPRLRWAWTVGGVGVALGPLLGFSSSTVNPDALLFAISAALFYCLARAFRRGLTRMMAVAIGALMALGFVTKLNFAGIAPGAILGLVLLARREARGAGARAYARTLAPALAIAFSPAILYGAVNLLSGHHTFGIFSKGFAGLTGSHGSLSGELSYIWQYYLPRLPGMHNDFGELDTTRQVWLRNFVGLYGWADTPFPNWVYNAALIPLGAIAVLFVRSLALERVTLVRRRAELATYTVMMLGLMLLVGASGYLAFPSTAVEFTDARYSLPMLALWAAVLALAARGAGRRWGPVAGVLIVMLVIGHDLLSQLQEIARFYA